MNKTKFTHFIVYDHSQQRDDCSWSEVYDTREQAEDYIENHWKLNCFEIHECNKEGSEIS